MERISKVKISWSGLVAGIESIVNEWQPPVFKTERAYNDDLAKHLRVRLPEDTRVEREYRHEGTTCDLCVLYKGILSSDQVFIEVKRNLKKKPDYDRLVGQVEGLKPRKNKVLVVLVGDTSEELYGRLKDQFEYYLGNEGADGPSFRIIRCT